MARPRATQPTNAELAILRVLWALGPSTVRAVHEGLERKDDVGYTTTLKLLQIMVAKGLARRTEKGRVHHYRAVTSQSDTQQSLVNDLVDRAFGGSTAGLVMQALSSKPASADELRRIRDLVDRAQGDHQ